MQAFLPTIPVCFKQLNLDSNKSTKADTATPATDTQFTVLCVGDNHVYHNEPLTGWRNWRTVGNVAYAQHPTEEWYVKVDSLRVLALIIEEHQPFEQLRLAICSQSTTALALSPVCEDAIIPEFSQEMIYASLSRKSVKNANPHIRFIKDVDLTNRTVTVEELDGDGHHTYCMTWLELLTKFTVKKASPAQHRIYHEIANSRQPETDQLSQETAALYYSYTQGGLYLPGNKPHLNDVLNQIIHQLHLVDVDTQIHGPNVGAGPYDIDIKVSIQQFFQLCDCGWFFAQWLTPHPEIVYHRPFFAYSRRVTFAGSEATTGILKWDYSVKDNQHCLSISNVQGNKFFIDFCANSLPELATLVREWMVLNIETIIINPEAILSLNEEDQLVATLIRM